MQSNTPEMSPSQAIADIANTIDDDRAEASRALNEIFSVLEPEDLALALEALPLDKRLVVFNLIHKDEKIDVLVAMRGEARLLLLANLPEDELPELFDEVDAEDLVELAETVPASVVDLALGRMDARQRKFYELAQQYEEESVGRWLNHDVLVVPQNTRVTEALRSLRRDTGSFTEVLYLLDRTGRWSGCVMINRLIGAQPHQTVAALKEEDYPSLIATKNMYEAAEEVERSGYAALPVVSDDGLFLGRLDVGTAMDLLREQAEVQLMGTAGLDEDADLFAPVRRSAQTRAVWLGVNLVNAFFTASFIGLFEATIQQVVALAVLMPVVASMGGIAGSQTLTLIVRGLALKQISSGNFSPLLIKEVRVGALNGVLWSLVIGLIAFVWFKSVLLGMVIAAAIVINIMSAAVAGVIVPVTLDKLKMDPALSGSVIVTTVTDVVGFVAFLGLGTVILL